MSGSSRRCWSRRGLVAALLLSTACANAGRAVRSAEPTTQPTGRLIVRGTPEGATVHVGPTISQQQWWKGTLPLQLDEIPAGRYTVLVMSDEEEVVPAMETIVVEPDGLCELEVVLERSDSESSVKKGPPERAQVADAIRRDLSAITDCFERQLEHRPRLKGKVVIKLVIGLDGKVADASIATNTFEDGLVGSCLVDRARGWTIPEQEERRELEFPFVFSSGAL